MEKTSKNPTFRQLIDEADFFFRLYFLPQPDPGGHIIFNVKLLSTTYFSSPHTTDELIPAVKMITKFLWQHLSSPPDSYRMLSNRRVEQEAFCTHTYRTQKKSRKNRSRTIINHSIFSRFIIFFSSLPLLPSSFSHRYSSRWWVFCVCCFCSSHFDCEYGSTAGPVKLIVVSPLWIESECFSPLILSAGMCIVSMSCFWFQWFINRVPWCLKRRSEVNQDSHTHNFSREWQTENEK